MHEIFFLSDILFTSCYFTCTCLVLEISLFGSIVVKQKQKHRSKFFIFGIQIHIWIGSAHHESIRKMPWRKRNQFSNTKSIVKVEAGIVTLISYRHYLKIVENPKQTSALVDNRVGNRLSGVYMQNSTNTIVNHGHNS